MRNLLAAHISASVHGNKVSVRVSWVVSHIKLLYVYLMYRSACQMCTTYKLILQPLFLSRMLDCTWRILFLQFWLVFMIKTAEYVTMPVKLCITLPRLQEALYYHSSMMCLMASVKWVIPYHAVNHWVSQ